MSGAESERARGVRAFNAARLERPGLVGRPLPATADKVDVPDALSVVVDTVAAFWFPVWRSEVPAVAVGHAVRAGTCTELQILWELNDYSTGAVFFSTRLEVFGGFTRQLRARSAKPVDICNACWLYDCGQCELPSRCACPKCHPVRAPFAFAVSTPASVVPDDPAPGDPPAGVLTGRATV